MNIKRWVGLFSSHANELRKAHCHVRRDAPTGSCASKAPKPKRKAQPRISDDRADQIVEAYVSGKTVYDLAREFNCHRVTISAVLKRRGVALRGASPTEEQAIEMVRLYLSGLSLAKVGEHFDVHASTVLAQLRRRAVTTRSR